MKCGAFLVHCYADFRKDRLYLVGRLENGQSFAAVEGKWRPSLHINESDREKAESALSSIIYTVSPPALTAFDLREKLLLIQFSHFRDYNTAVKLLGKANITSPDSDLKIPDAYLMGKHILGPLEIDGEARPGRLVDLVFPEPEIRSAAKTDVELRIASVDIETDVLEGTILALAVSCGPGVRRNLVRVLNRPDSPKQESIPGQNIFFHWDEASLLASFLEDIRKADPDVITGWNILDFDFPRLAERFAFHNIRFTLGRSKD